MSSVTMFQAEEAFQAAEWEKASMAFLTVLEQEPGNVEACQRLAQVRAVRGNLRQVVTTYLQLMDILQSQGNLGAALQVADWIRAIQPDSIEARSKAIELHWLQGDQQQAAQVALSLVRHYIDIGCGDEALALLARMQQLQPDNLELGLEMAETLVVQGQIREGAARYREMAEILQSQDNLERAAEAYRRLKLLQPEDCSCCLQLGHLYARLELYSEAEQEFRGVLRQNLNHEEALMALGEVCKRKSRWRDAHLAFQRVLSLVPESFTAHEQLGEVYRLQAQIEQAVGHYLVAAQGYFQSQQRPQAIRLYRLVLTLQPENSTALQELTKLDAPVEPLEVRAVAAAPTALPEAQTASGSLHRAGLRPRPQSKPRLGEAPEKPRVEALILRNTDKPRLLARASAVETSLPEDFLPVVAEESTTSWFEEEAEVAPDWLQQVTVNWLKVAREQVEMGHKEAAESAYLTALERNPNLETGWELAHLYLLDFRDLNKAAREYTRLHAIQPEDAQLTAEYVAVLLDLGRVDEAVQVLRAAPNGAVVAGQVIGELQKMVEQTPQAKRHRQVLGQILCSLGEVEAGSVYLQTSPDLGAWLTEGVCYAS